MRFERRGGFELSPGEVRVPSSLAQKGKSAKLSGMPAPRIGAHVNGGLKGAVAKAVEIGAEAIQIFIGSPQSWKGPNPSEGDIAAFMEGVSRERLGPVFVHGNYLVNLAASSAENLEKSVENLRLALHLSNSVGAAGLIFILALLGKPLTARLWIRVLRSLSTVLDGYDGTCRLLLEVCAGQGQTIGDRFSQFGDIINSLDRDPRLGVCWDTCHLYNAGYDLGSKRGLLRTMEEFEETVGFEWLHALHANDSKTPLGARRDRHENIGFGCIGEEAFGNMLAMAELRAVPWILEVPGQERKGPDRANLEVLRQLAGNARCSGRSSLTT